MYWCPIEYALDYERPGGFVRYYTDVFAAFGKHVQDSFGTPGLAPWLKEVLDIVFGGPEAVRERMPMSFLITPTSPLTIEHDFTQTWLELRDYGLPVAVMPMPLQGATAPGSRLGTLLAANCETSARCASSRRRPRHAGAVLAGRRDDGPAHGLYAAGAVEHAVLCVAGTEMARYYGLPAESWGLSTQTYLPDLQTAWEKADSRLPGDARRPGRPLRSRPARRRGHALPRADRVRCRAMRQARQACTGIPVREDLWLDEVLDRVGPGGSFLGERSTRLNARNGEWRLNEFGMHGGRDAWRAAGSPSTLAAARERVERGSRGRHRRRCRTATDQAAALAALQRRADAAS